jgi:hypothetical protein
LLLNKTYLSTLAYVMNEWEIVKADADILASPPAAWDSRRKYKVGDLVAFSVTTGKRPGIYRAVANAPENPPTDLGLRFDLVLFRNELGHPATSKQLATFALVQATVTGLYLLACASTWLVFRSSAAGLLTATIAHMIAAHALSTLGNVDYREVNRLAAEISSSSQD